VLARGVGIRPSAIDQFGVLMSGALRLGLALVAIVMLLTPFGSGVDSTVERFGTVASGITVGDVSISPGAIIRAVVVLVVGLALARLFLRWLNDRYLPTTAMDVSARNSFAMIARYIAIILAVLWGLASLGIGMERIALLLSALSVGIGFGLQAITQNFVSGLILLAERPVKIGDLVRIGTDEGDVKRISVRSTEIELADHSTLIVPNSELITKTVLNKTMSNALGRLQVQFSVPLNVEPQRIRQIVLDVFAAEPTILDDPAPVAFIDNIVDGRILFNCFAHTSSPRTSYPARSSALMMILQKLAEEHIDVGTVPQQLQLLPAHRRDDEQGHHEPIG
jgi:small-conductance mechanosensitive channel